MRLMSSVTVTGTSTRSTSVLYDLMRVRRLAGVPLGSCEPLGCAAAAFCGGCELLGCAGGGSSFDGVRGVMWTWSAVPSPFWARAAGTAISRNARKIKANLRTMRDTCRGDGIRGRDDPRPEELRVMAI